MKKIVGYKKNGAHYDPIYEEVPDPIGKTIVKDELYKQIKDNVRSFFESTANYSGIGFDETSTRAYEKGAIMVLDILFPPSS